MNHLHVICFAISADSQSVLALRGPGGNSANSEIVSQREQEAQQWAPQRSHWSPPSSAGLGGKAKWKRARSRKQRVKKCA